MKQGAFHQILESLAGRKFKDIAATDLSSHLQALCLGIGLRQLDDTVDLLNRLHQANPDDPLWLKTLADCLDEKGLEDEAYKTICDASAIAQHPLVYFTMGRYLLDRGDPAQACFCLQESVKNLRHNFDAWLHLGDAHLELGDYRQAIACFDTAAEVGLVPLDEALSSVEHLVRAGELTQAREQLLLAYQSEPEMTDLILNRSVAMQQSGNLTGAHRQLVEASDSGTIDDRILAYRKELAELLGLTDDAEVCQSLLNDRAHIS